MTDYGNAVSNFVMPYDFGNHRDATYESNRYLVLRDMRLKICDRLDEIEEIRCDIRKEIDKVRSKFKKIAEEAETLDDNRDEKRLLFLEKMIDDYEEQLRKKLNEDLIFFGKHKAYREMLSELERALDSCFVETTIPS